MKVLLSVYECEPNRGSEPGYGWNWSVHLARAGYDVWVLTRPDGRSAIEQQLAVEPISNLHFVFVDVHDAVKPLLKGNPGVYAHYFLWQWAAYQVALRLEQEHSFDVVHHASWSTLTGGSWLWLLRKPFIFGPVGGGQLAPDAFRDYFFGGWKLEAIRSFVTRRLLPVSWPTRTMLQQASLVLAVNQETLELAQRLGARNTRLFLDAGLPDQYFADMPATVPSNGDVLKILWVGRLFPRKALPLTLEALSKVQIPFRLTVLGDGQLGNRVPDWIRMYGLEGKVDWRGWVPWEEVRQAYRSHDIFLFTSLRDTCPPQLLEAMANGLPPITLDHHGSRSLVPDDAGIKVAVTSPEETVVALARAVERTYADAEGRLAMSRAGLAFARTQEWSQKIAAMTLCYRAIVRDSDIVRHSDARRVAQTV